MLTIPGEMSLASCVVRRDITDPTASEGREVIQETVNTVMETFTNQTEGPKFGGTGKAFTLPGIQSKRANITEMLVSQLSQEMQLEILHFHSHAGDKPRLGIDIS